MARIINDEIQTPSPQRRANDKDPFDEQFDDVSPVRGELDTLVGKDTLTQGGAASDGDDEEADEKFVQVSASAHKPNQIHDFHLPSD